jgi:SAM-dependent methyltransferase
MSASTYIGCELSLFAEARRWKAYWYRQIERYVRGSVLEVGAGNGNNTLVFPMSSPAIVDQTTSGRATSGQNKWVCLEPDVSLCAELRNRVGRENKVQIIAGTLSAMSETPGFDTILYLDVLEHIEKDSRELALSARMLRPGGHLIVLSPAHRWLYSPFDRNIGHFRRYTRASLCSAVPGRLKLVVCRYLDCAGLAASAANALLLKQSLPTKRQILLWDRLLVPVSRRVDPLLRYSCGKSVLGIWCNEPA